MAEIAITNVKMPLKKGASFHLKETPASHPNASQITKAVVRGKTQAARRLAATKPTANKAPAYSPAKGASARAASAASVISMPSGKSTAPVVTMMNQATIQATTAPVTASIFWKNKSFRVTPFSTTLLCVKNIIQGAIVVPTIATVSERKLMSLLTSGMTV